jgi:hypothetical protein
VNAPWAHLPTSLLHEELARRQAAQPDGRPACGSKDKSPHYNLTTHLLALILILLLSTAACSFPLIVRRFPTLHIPEKALFLSRHFGTGVLIATAFVHLFPTAYTNLLDPCLAPFWTDVYPAMPGFIAMTSVFVVVGIEMFFATKGAGHSHTVDFAQLRGDGEPGVERRRPDMRQSTDSFNSFRRVPLRDDMVEKDVQLQEQRSPYQDSPRRPGSGSPSSSLNKPLPPEPEGDDSDLDLDELDPAADDDQAPLTRRTPSDDSDDDDHPVPANSHTNGPPKKYNRQVSWADQLPSQEHPHTTARTPEEQRLILQCLMLEAGILFHSVFICFYATKWEAQRYDTKTEHNENIEYRQRVTWSRPMASTQRRASGWACPAPQQQQPPAAFTAYQHVHIATTFLRLRSWTGFAEGRERDCTNARLWCEGSSAFCVGWRWWCFHHLYF